MSTTIVHVGGRRRRRIHRPVDIYLSDFVAESGTPLQWAVAWEAVTEREYAEATIRLAVFVAVETGWPLTSILTAVAAVGTKA